MEKVNIKHILRFIGGVLFLFILFFVMSFIEGKIENKTMQIGDEWINQWIK